MSTEHCHVDNQQQSARKVRKVKQRSAEKVKKVKQESEEKVTPLKWHGGKHYLFDTILGLMPPHLHYVEPFFGGGQVFFARDPKDPRLLWTSNGRQAKGVSEVVNDIDSNLMNFYEVLQDPALFPQLWRRLDMTLF